MTRFFIFSLLAFAGLQAASQELYVFSEPASNMPARSIAIKTSSVIGRTSNLRLVNRFTPEIQLGLSKNFMLHAGNTFSNMYSDKTRWESIYLYGKYRFLSIDDMHKHFRMAAFAEASYSRNDYMFDEVNIQGDRTGLQFGLIATELINKFAISGTISHTQALDPSRFDKVMYTPERLYQSINYSLSAGYLVLPFEYKSYDQLNMNVYAELLGQRTMDRRTNFLDLATSFQFIFNSNTKLNLGYRFPLKNNQHRGMQKSILLSLEHTFFNALKKKKN